MKDMLQLRHWIAHLRNQDDEWSVQHKPYKASNVQIVCSFFFKKSTSGKYIWIYWGSDLDSLKYNLE